MMYLRYNQTVIIFFTFLFFVTSCNSIKGNANESSSIDWTVNFAKDNRAFVENKGQFEKRIDVPGFDPLFAYDDGEEQILFSNTGVIYRLETRVRNPERPRGSREKAKRMKEVEYVHMRWEGANPDVIVEAKDPTDHYFVYTFVEGWEEQATSYEIADVRGYERIVYKNLYPNIDVEYVFHPETGIKYSFTVHPGGDISDVRMSYEMGGYTHQFEIRTPFNEKVPRILENREMRIESSGKLIIPTFFGDIVEHAPHTFYANHTNKLIPSEFVKNGQQVSFKLGDYDTTQTIIVDPWVQTPTMPNSNCVWELDRDGNGNVYIIGGDSPLRLQKYNSAGVLQWTHNTPYSVAADSVWLGTFATDQAGNSYVTNGSVAAIQKVNTNGNMVWNNSSPGGGTIGESDEYWNIAFNCDESSLIIGGTILTFLGELQAAIFDVNTNNGNINSSVVVNSASLFSFGQQEVRSISSSYNAQYYFLIHDSIGAIHHDLGNSPCSNSNEPYFKFMKSHGYDFTYKCENFRPSHGNSGIMAIRANQNFVYTQNGETIEKRSLADGSILNSAQIPGGVFIDDSIPFPPPPFPAYDTIIIRQAGNSGIAIDECGNVYVGSSDRVVKFDADFNVISSENLSFRVFDVVVGYNGQILVAGSTGDMNTPNRVGYVQAINMAACAPDSLVCCDANICPEEPMCLDDPAITLTAVTPGGTWSGNGITDTTAGVFDPATAGEGTHTIIYTIPCGSDSIQITVKECLLLEVCSEGDGSFTVSGGVEPYAWQVETLDCSGCPFGECIPFICEGNMIWVTYTTGATATIDSLPVKIADANGNEILITDTVGLPECIDCPDIILTVISQSDVSCFGENDGAASIEATNGNAPYTYTWQPGNLDGATQNNLSPNIYTIIVEDSLGCTEQTTVSINEPDELNLSMSSQPTTCGFDNGSVSVSVVGGLQPYQYEWNTSPVQTDSAIVDLSAGVYTVLVTDDNGCTVQDSVLVEDSGEPEINITHTDAACGLENGSATASVSGTVNFSFFWSNGESGETISDLAPGVYYVTVDDGAGCIGIDSVTIDSSTELFVDIIKTDSNCDADNGTAIASVQSGVTNVTYTWSNNQTGDTITGLAPGVYTVTADAGQGCTGTATVTIEEITFTIQSEIENATCNLANGQISVFPSDTTVQYTFEWSNQASGSVNSALSEGNYSVTVTDEFGCEITETFTLTGTNVPLLSYTVLPDTCGLDVGQIVLEPEAGITPYTYHWSHDASVNSPVAVNLPAGTYEVTITDAADCSTDAEILLECIEEISPGISIYIPNVISPESDMDENKRFQVLGQGIEHVEMMIWNRWGELVFEGSGVNTAWDGTVRGEKVSSAVFVYYVTVRFANLTQETYKGSLTVIR